MGDEMRLFTESSESLGIMFTGYKGISKKLSKFLTTIDATVDIINKDPKANINLKAEISEFKAVVIKKIEPREIIIGKIAPLEKEIQTFQEELDEILTDYSKIRDKVSYGGNYIRAILKRPKVYSSTIDPESYTKINANIRMIDRALDWAEKALIDLFNMADQDLNILTIVKRVYKKHHIYENALPDSTGRYTMENLPNTMYFASPTKITELKDRVFLTPYIGIASIFIIDRFNVLKNYARKILAVKQVSLSANISYDEWGLQNHELLKPLDMIHMTHNIKDLPGVAKGVSTGYIYTIDISDISKDQLSMFVTMDPNREIIYKGSKPLKIINVQEHTANWELRYDPQNMMRHGTGSVKIMESYNSIEELKNAYLHEMSGCPDRVNCEKYFRVSYDGIGIYEALKQSMSFDEWKAFLRSDSVTWLPKPPTYSDTARSYFTKDGFDIFMKLTMPIIEAHLDKSKIIVNEFNDIGNIVYRDQYQVVTDNIHESYCERGNTMDEDDDLSWITAYLMEDVEEPNSEPPSMPEEKPKEEKPEENESMPKKTDKAESSKNGVRRKRLYIAFIEWCKEYNPKNTFGSIFDKDAFNVSYPFVPEEMRYFYRLANPMLCVLAGELTFFAASELRKLNSKNSHLNEMMIFAATTNDLRVFNVKDKKIYRGTEENGAIKLSDVLGDTFDTYIQKMINKGDILNGPIEESAEFE